MTRLNWLRNLSPIDGAAAAIACLALVGVVWSPKLNQAIAKASGSMQSVGVSVDVRNLQLSQPERLRQSIRDEGSLNIVIRNQPAGRVQLLEVLDITQPLMVVQPDGRIVEALMANQSQGFHVRFSLKADAEADTSGVVFGGTKLKIGVPVDLQGRLYSFRGVVSGITLP
jgi:RNase adaptor protein for sRNA GlmZ degradation